MSTVPPIPEPAVPKALPLPSKDLTPTKISFRRSRSFELHDTKFSAEVQEAIKKWVHEKIRVYKKQLERLNKHEIPRFRDIADGQPKEREKSFPFEGCSNLVVQLVGQTIDDIAARVMAIVYLTSPIAIYRWLEKAPDSQAAQHNLNKCRSLETFFDYVAYEPTELDLYRIENIWFADSSRLGTAFVKVRPEVKIEAEYVGYDAEAKKTEMKETVMYRGPKVVNLEHEDVGCDPKVDTLDESKVVYHVLSLDRRDFVERVADKMYPQEQVDKILAHPDRYGASEIKKRAQRKEGIDPAEETSMAEWDVHECYFSWFHNDVKYRLIMWYHFETKTVLRLVFNFIPHNQLPIVKTKLSNDRKGQFGKGYAWMLDHYQEELSTTKNQRHDATAFGILGMNRIDPSNKNIDRNFQVYPGAAAPFRQGEFEHISIGEPNMSSVSIENEQMIQRQAQDRAGVGPAVAGMGAGSADKKGRFGSMGTVAVMQDANSRVGHRTSDFRHSHVRLGSLSTDMYGAMGTGGKGALFGVDDRILEEALSDFLERRIRIPIRASSAAANREVRKQNLLLLNATLRQHHMGMSNLLQAIANAAIPEQFKEYFIAVTRGQNNFFWQVLREFEFDQPEAYAPEPKFGDEDGKAGGGGGVGPVAEASSGPGGSAGPGGPAGLLQTLSGMAGPGSGPAGPSRT